MQPWVSRKDPTKPAPFDPSYSWALSAGHVDVGASRSLSVKLAWIATVLFTLTGLAVALDTSAWSSLAIAAASVGLGLKVLWFNRWLMLAVALDVAIVVAASVSWPGGLAS